MHFLVVSSLIYIKARGLVELFPPKLRNFWKYWELRVLLLLSLMLQIVLIIFGNRRKYTSKTLEILVAASSGFAKPHVTDSTHHFWQPQKVYKKNMDQNCLVMCLSDG